MTAYKLQQLVGRGVNESIPETPFFGLKKKKNDPIKITCLINFMFVLAKKKKKGKEDISIVWFQGWKENERIEEKVSLGPIKPCLPKLGGRARNAE